MTEPISKLILYFIQGQIITASKEMQIYIITTHRNKNYENNKTNKLIYILKTKLRGLKYQKKLNKANLILKYIEELIITLIIIMLQKNS